MFRSRVIASLGVLAVCFCASTAFALGPPSLATSSIPRAINLVGESASGQTDPEGLFTVTVRDAAGSLIPGCTVEVHFNNIPEMSVGSTQNYPGLSVTCVPYPVVSATADANGIARFSISGAVINHLTGPTGCSGTIVANDGSSGQVHLGTINIAAFDLDGEFGVTTNDVYLWLCDFGRGTSPCWSDFDHQGGVGASDLSRMITVMTREGSRVTPALCTPFTGVPGSTDVATGGLSWTNVVCTTSPNYIPMTSMCAATSALKFTEFLLSVNLSTAGISALSEYTGAEAVIRIIDPGKLITTNLSDYWRFAVGGCHANGLSPIGATSLNCLGNGANPLYPCDMSNPALEPTWPHPSGALNAELVHAYSIAGQQACSATFPASGSFPVMDIKLSHKPTCAGCADPIAIVLEYVRLTTLGDPLLDCCACTLKPQTIPLNGPGGARRLVTLRPAPGDNVIIYTNGQAVSAPGDVPASDVWFGAAEPNPSSGESRMAFRLPSSAMVIAQVLDVTGRRIATIADGEFPAGNHTLRWDGRNSDGGPAPTGAYILYVRAGDQAVMRTVMLRR